MLIFYTMKNKKDISTDQLHTLKHIDECSQSWLEAGLCCHWISRRRIPDEQLVTLMREQGS